MTKTIERFIFVYVGIEEGEKNKKFYKWLNFPSGYPVTGPELHTPDGQARYFSKPLKGIPASPGAIWEMAADVEDGKTSGVYTLSPDESLKPIFKGHIKDMSLLRQWQARSRANEAAIANNNRIEKEAKRDFNHEALEPIREAYRRASYQKRVYILAEVIRIITS